MKTRLYKIVANEDIKQLGDEVTQELMQGFRALGAPFAVTTPAGTTFYQAVQFKGPGNGKVPVIAQDKIATIEPDILEDLV